MTYQLLNIIAPAVLGIACLLIQSDNKKIMHFLGIYFLITALGEVIGYLLKIYYSGAVNVFFYDKFFIPLQYLLTFAFFGMVFRQKNYKITSFVLAAIYFVCFLVEKFIVQYKSQELSYFSYCIGSIFIMLLCLLYLLHLVKSTTILHFKKDIIFWFCIGTLFFQLFTFPFFALMDVWFVYPDIGNTYFYFTIYCIHISYLLYSAGLLCLKIK